MKVIAILGWNRDEGGLTIRIEPGMKPGWSGAQPGWKGCDNNFFSSEINALAMAQGNLGGEGQFRMNRDDSSWSS